MKTLNCPTIWPFRREGENCRLIGTAMVLITALFTSSLWPTTSLAQDEEDEDLYELSPFTVEDDEYIGYLATSTLAGTRLNTRLEDVGTSISVLTKEFLEDVGATDNQDLLLYLTNAEVGGVRGNFTGVGNGANLSENSLFTRPNNNTRLRGLDRSDNTRNYFRSLIPFDAYNTTRVDMVRGANSILFGLGSPAGIINTTLQSAVFSDINEITVRFDQHGSQRMITNINQELLEDELAVRVILLSNEAKYRQDPAFSDSTRAYVAARWDPAFLNSDSMTTSFKVNYENGQIDSNNPRLMTPKDQITPFFKSGGGIEGGLNKFTLNQYIGNYSGATAGWATLADVPQDIYNMDQALKGFDSQGKKIWGISSNLGDNRDPWIRGSMGTIFDEIVAYSNSNTGHEFQQASYVIHVPPPHAFRENPRIRGGGVSQGRWQGPNVFSDYARRARLPHWDLGVYKDRHINDRSIFDYKNHLLDGPNKSEFHDFDGLQFTFSQTFLNGNLGYEVGVDRQEAEWGQTSIFNEAQSGSSIAIDINEVLPDGSPNPNLGRAVLTSTMLWTNNDNFHEIDQSRATIYGKLDFQEWMGDNFLGRLLGNHVLTGFFSSDEESTERREFSRYSAPVSFAERLLSADKSITSSMSRKISVAHYISGDLRGQDWPTGLSPVKAVITPIQGGNVRFFDPTWIATGVDHLAEWIDPYYPQAGALQEYDNPANYAGWTTEPFTIMDATTGDKEDMYHGASLTATEIDSEAFIWQGYMLNGALVPLFGYRKDTSYAYAHQGVRQAGLDTVDLNSPNYRLPDEPTGETSGITRTYSLVAHVHDLIPWNLPYGVGLSLFYNQSENFQPAAQRVNHMGRTLPSPTGETKDWGFLVSAPDDKYSFRLNWYQSDIKTASYGLPSAWAIGWTTQMPWAYAKKAQNKVESFAVSGWNPQGGYSFQAGSEPFPDGDGQSYTEEEVLGAFFDYFNSIPQEFLDAWNINTSDAQWMIPGWPAGVGYRPPVGMTGTADNKSEGLEVEFIANPTPNWRVSLNVSKTEANRANVGGDLVAFLEERAEAYNGPAGAVRLWGPGRSYVNSIRSWFRGYLWGDFQLAKLNEGSDAPEIRKWHANFVNNYSFNEGRLKGSYVGGAARYMSGKIVGYPVIDNLEGQTDFIWEISNPYLSDPETRIDFWIGHRRKLTDALDWKVQLNITDAFADDELIPINVQPDGSYGALRIPPSTSWFITNTFMF